MFVSKTYLMMKRLHIILALMLALSLPMMAERVTPEKARKAATTFLNNNGTKTAQLTDLSKAAGFTNLYIFNAEQGFVVMAADDCVQPILGYSLTGKFVAENMPENITSWLQGYSDEIQFAIDSKAKPSAETAKRWKDLIDGNSKAAKATPVVDNMLSTTWDQHPRYNNMCPIYPSTNELTVTGCVATAMAQIMKYWEYPSRGYSSRSYSWQGQTLSANFGNTTYDWANMPSSLSSASTSQEINAVALLMYHCGVSVQMNYDIANNGGSSASEYAAASAYISYFRYNSSPQPQVILKKNYNNTNWLNSLKTELNESRPIQYFGSGTGGGHSFVCCGYDSDDNFYFNWGWSGNNDGFYSLGNLVPGSGGAGGGSYSFTNNQEAIIKIQPMFNNNPPSNLQATVEQGTGYRNISLSWSAATDASQYRIYRNNQNLATVSANDLTYTDVNVAYGTYNYQVRSVDADGLLSQPTNTATVTLEFLEPVVNDLNATPNGNDIALSWTALAADTQSATLQYMDCASPAYLYTLASWGVRFPASMLQNYDGLTLTSVGNWCTYGDTYFVNVYQCTTPTPTGTPIKTLSFSFPSGTTVARWNELTFDPIYLDPTKDLWVVYSSQSQVTGCTYVRPGSAEDGNYYLYNGNWYHLNSERVFPIAAGITYGTYTYNLYRNGEKVAQNMSTTNFTDPNRDNAASYYTVTTNYFGGESAASNGVGHTIGQGSLNSLELGANDRMTVSENSTLTVTGTLSNDNPENLVLENGAQLIHNSEGVKATVKKGISAYTVQQNEGDDYTDGWRLIASPVADDIEPSAANGLLNGDYDLYYYDEPTHVWKNHKANNFDLAFEHGYLYANGDGTALQMAGVLQPSDESYTISNLSYTDELTTLQGFNLVGNPFVCDATVDKDFYVMNENGTEIGVPETGRKVAPCEAIFVMATDSDRTVTFSKAEASKGSQTACLDITVNQGRSLIDRVRVRADEGTSMEKFNLNENSARLYIPQNGHDFAVVYANGLNELPLNFKAAENGTYSIGIETNSLNLGYLHLIDNMTGDDIDLLATPSYNFEAKTTDYASRFRLVFNADDASTSSASDATFAYVSNGEIVITADARDASLQVVDMMGRVVLCTDVARNVSTTGIPAGVYVLRLIEGENIRTQKIVIE